MTIFTRLSQRVCNILRGKSRRHRRGLTNASLRSTTFEMLESRALLAGFADDFEGAVLDAFWTTNERSGDVVFPATNRAHSGSQSVRFESFNTRDQKEVFLIHDFAQGEYGSFSVWAFDTGADISSSNYIGCQLNGENDRASLFSQDYDLGPGNNGSTYSYNSSLSSTNSTNVDRTYGWHEFRIDTTPDNVQFYIDGAHVATRDSGLAVTSVYLFMQGPSWRPAWETSFDDFSFVPLVPPDIAVQSAQLQPGNNLRLNYEITGAPGPFRFDFHSSSEQSFSTLDTIVVDDPADLSTGSHTLTVALGPNAGEVALPGFGFDETNDDYLLIAAAVPLSLGEADSSNNFADITGAYHPAGGPIFIHGGDNSDSVMVSAIGKTLNVNLNGTPLAYSNGVGSDVTEVRARLHGGDDIFDTIAIAKSTFVLGGAGNDDLRGGKGIDTIHGGNGADTLRMTPGADELVGGLGEDLLIGANSTTNWIVTAANAGSTTARVSFAEVEALQGGSGADRFRIGEDAGISGGIDGGAGLNTLVGPNQASFWSITGADTGLLNDESFVNIQSIVGGSQADLFSIENGGSLANSLDGGGGIDALDYSALTSQVTVNLAAKTASGLASVLRVESFIGGSGINTFIGPNVASTWRVTGPSAGKVASTSFTAFANLTGGSLNDTFIFSAGQGVPGEVDGGAGENTVDYSEYASAVTVNLNTGSATGIGGGLTNFRNAIGGAGADQLTGNTLANILLGGAGGDTLIGGGGNDVLVGGTGNDRLIGGVDRSVLIGGRGADAVFGGAAGDLLIAGSTSYDSNRAALAAILAEWARADLDYNTQVSHLRGESAGGLNGTIWLSRATVRDDATADSVLGGAGLDWFWASLGEVGDLEALEAVG